MTIQPQNPVSPDTSSTTLDLGAAFFKYRDYTPIPLILLILIFATPCVATAVIGLCLIVMGELIRIYAVSFIGSISRTRKDRTGGELVQEGAFRYVRNPLYVGNFFITFGVAVFAGVWPLILLTVVLFATQYYFIVKYEENWLLANFGDAYKAYCEKVPAFWPKSWPKLDDLEWPESFSPALKSETKTLMAIAAMVALLTVLA